ncbi:glycosyltransferase family 2 protein [Pseudothauera rhizosphaerae]|uniref:Glycosyltransferase n=1 Tax=Pseudothauera rhizosphaerae TaxID=2565932 RepID=A0A4S4AC12_9RHOO|nr:glycosyltransferase [Pseudothauera rhizosphaerae]THF56186.1 glycosyltransferase [Pseudothauera rhizosphaerae]
MPPVVSVCIAHFNSIDLIDACIESVRRQDCDFEVEIIVHDDASTDGSAHHLRTTHPDVHLIASTENVGFCVANNRMADAARGEFLLLLNNDAALHVDALVSLRAEAERLSRPAVLTLPQFDAETGDLLDIGLQLDPFLNPVPNRDRLRNEVGTVHGACLWIPKALWYELGGFPEWFGSFAEDLYLCCRTRLAGHPVRALGVSGYRHYVGRSFGGGKAHAGQLATTVRRRALSERNKTFVMAIIYPAPVIYLIMPVHLMLLLFEGLLLAALLCQPALPSQIYLPVFGSLWDRRKLLCKERHIAVRERRATLRAFFSVFDPLPHKLRLLLRHGLPTLRK